MFKNVSKEFQTPNGTIKALNDVSFIINEGEAVVLKGRSGSGKSTILSLIAALSKPTCGEIIVEGEQIARMSDDFASAFRLRHIGFVFQRFNLFEQLSVFENVLAPLIPLELSKDEVHSRINSVLRRFHIETKKDVTTKLLSGGEQQRVSIARALINDPKIILADEPTANLDTTLSYEFIEVIKELKNAKKTIVVATHDPLFFDLEFIDRIIELDGGEVC